MAGTLNTEKAKVNGVEVTEQEKTVLDELLAKVNMEQAENDAQFKVLDAELTSEIVGTLRGHFAKNLIYNIPRYSARGAKSHPECDLIEGGCPYKNQRPHIHILGVGYQGALTAFRAYGRMSAKVKDMPKTVEQGDKLYWAAYGEAIDRHTGADLGRWYMEPVMRKAGNGYIENEFGASIAQSKALRNVILALIPAKLMEGWIDDYKAGKQSFDVQRAKDMGYGPEKKQDPPPREQPQRQEERPRNVQTPGERNLAEVMEKLAPKLDIDKTTLALYYADQGWTIGKAMVAFSRALNNTDELDTLATNIAEWVESQKPDPDTPGKGGKDMEKQSHHGWEDQAAMEVNSRTDDYDPKTEPVDGLSPEEAEKEHERQEAFRKQQKDAKAEAGSTQLQLFLAEAKLRFKTDEDRDRWIAGRVESKPMTEWSGTEIALITEQLMYIDELPQDATEPEQTAEQVFMLEAGKRMSGIVSLRVWSEELAGIPYSEWTPEQFSEYLPALMAVSLPMNKATLAEIRTALAELPGQVLQTMKSNKFKAFASEALGLDKVMGTITERGEEEARIVITALAEKKSALLLAALDTGEIVDEDPLEQGDPVAKTNDEQVMKIDELIPEMPERFQGITGSQAFRDFAVEKTGRTSYPGVREFTASEGDAIIRAMLKEVVVEKERKAKQAKPEEIFKTG